jgi:hypothetical protein
VPTERPSWLAVLSRLLRHIGVRRTVVHIAGGVGVRSAEHQYGF